MKRNVIYCYGDSNTWGYDSRAFAGERYPREVRWTGILEEKSGCHVINDGMNGRKIPVNEMQLDFLVGHIREMLKQNREQEASGGAALLIMLGTNDLLTNPRGGARDAAEKMERFLARLSERLGGKHTESLPECLSRRQTESRQDSLGEVHPECGQLSAAEGKTLEIRLISPPLLRRGAWVETDALVEQSRLLGGEFRKAAEKYGVSFTDAGAWDIPLLYDGVHFSEEGHRAFAAEMLKIIV